MTTEDLIGQLRPQSVVTGLAARWRSVVNELGDRRVSADALFDLLKLETAEWKSESTEPDTVSQRNPLHSAEVLSPAGE